MIKFVRSRIKRIFASITLLSVEIIALLGVFSVALVAFIGIANMIFTEKKETFDDRAFNFLSKHVNTINTDMMQIFTFLGTHTFLIPANLILISYLLFIKKHRWYSISVPVIALSSLLLMVILKIIFQRDRPLSPLLSAAQGYSFPSGHATMAITFYGLIIFLVFRNVKNKVLRWALIILLSLLIIAIGVSRVYLRVHYASDVLAGFCLGLMWLLFSLWLLKKIEIYSLKKVDPAVQLAPR